MYNFYKHSLDCTWGDSQIRPLTCCGCKPLADYNFSPGSVPVSNSRCWTLVLLCAFGNPRSCGIPVLFCAFSLAFLSHFNFYASLLFCAFGNALLSSFVPPVSILVPFYFYANVLTFLISCSFVSMVFLSCFVSTAFLSCFVPSV